MTTHPKGSDAGAMPVALTGTVPAKTAAIADEGTLRGDETNATAPVVTTAKPRRKYKYKDKRSWADRGRVTGRPPGRPKGKTKFRMSQVADALRRSGGIQSEAIRILHKTYGKTVATSTMSGWVAKYEILQRAIAEGEKVIVDCAEGHLMRKVAAGKDWAVRFILQTKGRDRGYVSKTEITTPANQPLKVSADWSAVPQAELRALFEAHQAAVAAAKRQSESEAASGATSAAA